MIDLERLLRATARHGGELVGPAFSGDFAGFSHDSRTVAPGELFVALRTEKDDGHAYIGDAVSRGATGVLCERPPAVPGGSNAAEATVIRVSDTRAALLDWATLALREQLLSRIAVVGSVGKSGVCAALLRALVGPLDTGTVFTNGNRNDELGLPLSLGGLRPEHETAVFEVAGSTGAELVRLGELVRPELAIVTAGAITDARDTASIALRDGLAGFLAAVAPAAPKGTAVVNGDDRDLEDLLVATLPAELRRIEYGFGPGMAVSGRLVESGRDGTALEVTHGERIVRLRTAGAGLGLAYAALAALAAIVALDGDLEAAAARLDGLTPEPGRLARLAGRADLTVLDDTVNAGIASLRLALRTLDLFPRPHLAVLGEIGGVGDAGDLPDELVRRLLELDRLVLQGRELTPLSRELRARSLQPDRIVPSYSARDSADAVISSIEVRAARETVGDVSRSTGGGAGTVLVKGSDAARMERVVELLLPEGAATRDLLVRQDEGWRRRTYVPNERPTWVEVDLEAIRSNLQLLRELAAPAEVMAVLKADAYGHGARWVARTAALNGAAMLGVASLNEALDLRADGIRTPILILGYAPPWQARDLATSLIRATIFSLPVAEHFSRVASDLGRTITVHIKVDTGMTRLGVLPEDVPAFVDAVAALPGLELEGIFSHLATSDSDVEFALEQGERFAALLRVLEARGRRFRYVHMENSGAIMRRLPFAFNLVRVGLALYGLSPLPKGETELPLRPALSFKTRVAQVKDVAAGTSVSYGREFVTQRPSRIAVLPVGYGDGFRRSPRHWGHVLVRGRRAPLAGIVAMDMAMVDVTDVDGVQEGDEVVLIGTQGGESITAEDAARALGTISYELVTQILPRVPRQMR